MPRLRVASSLDECREAWNRAFTRENISDLWEVRECFQKHFQRPPHFILCEHDGNLTGLLPLSWVEESHCYQYFPGETWANKTWLEQNRILAHGHDTLELLLQNCPAQMHLRYLLPQEKPPHDTAVDEIGYLFRPADFDFNTENYFALFSGKNARRLKKEITELAAPGVEFRLDDLADFDRLVQMNIGRFGAGSYFYDERFRESFRSLMHLLHERGWLKMTAVLIGGELAAVDIGCLYRGTYTLLGGGTSANFPGVAKLINIYHIERACRERFELVDFLCGDFTWKKLFHLTPRPLYLISNKEEQSPPHAQVATGSAACVG